MRTKYVLETEHCVSYPESCVYLISMVFVQL